MFQITIDTAQQLHDHITELYRYTIERASDKEDLRYDYVHLNSMICCQILTELIKTHKGLMRFSEDEIKIPLSDKFIKAFVSIESKL